MTDSPINRLIGRLQSHGCNPRETGSGQWKSRCPAHNGRSQNLSIKEADDGTVVLHCHHVEATGQTCSPQVIVGALGLEMRDLFPDRPGAPSRKPKPPTVQSNGKGHSNGRAYKSPEAAVASVSKALGRPPSQSWVYKEPGGSELMRVYRFNLADGSKEFRPVHRDLAGWHLGDPPGKLPLYHLDELAHATVVFVPEGEKCADIVKGLKLSATTSSHGAQAPGKTDWAPLAGKAVVILPDHDAAGEGYATAVAGILVGLDPRPTIKILRLPFEGGPWEGDGEDIEQWLERLPDAWGPDECRAELERLAAEAPVWKPVPSSILALHSGDDEEDNVRDPVGDIDPRAFHGALGELALKTQCETEANPVFVLLQLLTFLGATVGREPHFVVSAQKHRLNLFVGLIGLSGHGRKGTSGHVAKAIWSKVDPIFTQENITDGLNSGAGLLYHLRDASTRIGKNGHPIRDEGVSDKRRVFLEQEFASVLKQGHRESDPLLEYLRKFFDGEEIVRSNTKEPLKVTGGHVGIVGHCTPADLEIHLSDANKVNGTGNRLLWFFGVRSKVLPCGGDVFRLLDNGFLNAELEELRDALVFARVVHRIHRAPEVEARWVEIYRELDDVPPGRLGGFFSRAPVMVMGLASLYALSDRSRLIRDCHMDAALAVWDYSARSLRFIFKADVDARADRLLATLKASPEGLTKTQIANGVFNKNVEGGVIDELLTRLLAYRLIVRSEPASKGRGRPAPRYHLNRW
jgi:hypothetical protein